MADNNDINLQLSEFAAYEARDIGMQIMQIIYNEYVKAGAVAHGNNGGLISYANPNGSHWNFVWNGSRNALIMQIELPKYWHNIEDGLKPKDVEPFRALYPKILEWVKLKGIAPSPRQRIDPKTRKPIGNAYTPTQRQLAFAITRKIRAYGYFGYDAHGKRIIEISLDKARARGLIQELQTAVRNKLGEIIAIEHGTLKDVKSKYSN